MLLFDSRRLDVNVRSEAIRDLLATPGDSILFGPSTGGAPDDLTFRAWLVGPGATLFHASGPGFRIRHGRSRSGTGVQLALVTQPTGVAGLSRGGRHELLGRRSLSMCDMGRAFDYRSTCPGSSISYHLPMEDLRLLRDDVATAIPRLSSSPLAPLLRDHVADVLHQAETGSIHPSIHQATVDLARALIVSVLPVLPVLTLSHDHGAGTEAGNEAAWQSVSNYIRLHFVEPDLNEASVAAALGIPPAQLRRASTAKGVSVDGLIREHRVRSARADLDRPCTGGFTGRARLMSTAARWGLPSADDLLSALRQASS